MDVKNGEAKQERVFNLIVQAAKLLQSAVDLESEIESARLARFNPTFDDASDRQRDPLEERLRAILERLEEYGYTEAEQENE